MKLLRILLALGVGAYAIWLGWPVIQALIDGGPAAMTETALDMLSGPFPLLLIAAAGLYLAASLLLGAGKPSAVIAYFLGFLADAVLRLALDSRGEASPNARSAEITTMAAPETSGLPVDPVWLILAALLAVGFLVAAVARRRRARRTAGHLAA